MVSTRPVPLLILSDAPSSTTGLGRICRELALGINEHLSDLCRVATFGYAGSGSRSLPFQQYSMEDMRQGDWVANTLPQVWADWAGDEAGVILAIWDASRLLWFSRPVIVCEEPRLKRFLLSANLQRWIYAPIDGGGPNGGLSYPTVQSLLGFDRILTYSVWAEGIIRTALGKQRAEQRDLASVPHGIDQTIFYQRPRVLARKEFFNLTGATPIRGAVNPITGTDLLVGAVATNQPRKDWALWAEACALFLKRHPETRFWVHTDILERHWSIPQLLVDFGLQDRTCISLGYLSDEAMAMAYSACDLTVACGPEGFGYCIFESLFCGTPCVHGNYGGAPEHMPTSLLVDPVAFRYDGVFCTRRPVFDAAQWADKMDSALESSLDHTEDLQWTTVWPRFEKWFRKGLEKA